MPWNLFGCDQAAVLRRFALAGYSPTADDFGGTQAVDDAMADAAEEIIQAMPVDRLHDLEAPDLVCLVNRASQGQVQAVIPSGWRPAVSGSIHVWTGPPQAFTSRPILRTNPWGNNVGAWPSPSPTPPGAAVELAETDFTVGGDGYTITLSAALNRNDQVFASWRTDVESASYSVPSLAGAVAMGAAAALGAKVYPQATAEWAMVSRLAEGFADFIQGLARGAIVPVEIRSAQWWKEAGTVDAATIGSVRRYRA